MSRILRHVGRDDFKKTRQRQIGEQKERAAQKLKEWQEAEAERKQIEEASRPYKSNWRRENLREFGEWAPIETSGPANSTSTTFGYFAGGSPVINGETGQQVTFTYSGLQGVENYPTTVTINQGFGDTFQTDPPSFSQIGVQGYTAKLNPRYAEAQKKYQEEMKVWEIKKEQQQKDIEATLKSFGTSYRNVQKDGGITKVGNSYVAIIPTNTRDFGSNLLNNVRVVRLVPCIPGQPMELTKNVRDISGTKKWNLTNAQYSDDVYLQIGEQPKEPMEQQYLMPRRTDFNNVNPQLDASQEFAQKVGADEFMNGRVEDPGPTIAELERRSKLEIALNAKSDALSRQLEILYNQMNALPNGGRPIAYELVEPGDPDYIDVTSLPNAIGYNRRPIYSAAANAIQAKIEALMNQQNAIFARLNALSGAGPEKSGPEGDPSTWDPDGNGLYGPEPEKGEGDEEDPYAMEDPGVDPKDEDEVTKDDEDFLNKMNMLSKAAQSQLMQILNLPGEAAAWAVQYAKGDDTPVNKFSPAFKNQVLDLIGNSIEDGGNSVQYRDYNTDNPLKYNLSARLGLGRFNYERTPNGVRVTDTFNVDKFGTHTGAAQIIPGLQGAADRLVDIAHKRRGNSTSGIPIDVFIPKSQMSKKQRKRIFGESTWDKFNKYR